MLKVFTERPFTGQTKFNIPLLNVGGLAVTVNGVPATIASQSDWGFILSSPVNAEDIVTIVLEDVIEENSKNWAYTFNRDVSGNITTQERTDGRITQTRSFTNDAEGNVLTIGEWQ